MGNFRKKILWRVLGAIAFGVVNFIYSYLSTLNCPIGGVCYISPDAWYLLPLLTLIPAFIIQFSSHLIFAIFKYFKRSISMYPFIFTHAIISVVFLDTWLLFTGQGLQFLPDFDKDFPVFLSGAVMGGLIYFSSNPSIKWDALKRAPYVRR